jgi:hypothetical protein
LLAVALTGTLLASGCGDGGGGGPGPAAVATITAPSFTTGAGERASVALLLANNLPVASLQVDLVSPPDVIPQLEGAAPEGRAAGRLEAVVQNLELGRARLLLFDPDGTATIPAGQGPVLILTFRTGTVGAGVFLIGLEDGVVVDRDAERFDVTLVPGQATVR